MRTQSKRLAENKTIPASGTEYSDEFLLGDMVHFAAHVVIADDSGPVTGDLAIEVSNGHVGGSTIWEELDSKDTFVAGSQMWIDKNVPYGKFRIKYVNASANTGFLSVLVVAKGDN